MSSPAEFLFRETDIRPLAFFRIVFGFLGFADVLGVWIYYHLHLGYFDPEAFHFKYTWFGWVHPLPEPFMSIVFLLTMAAAAAVMLGWRYRLSILLFALGFSYIFLMEKALYLNHGYLFAWISWIMIFLPAGRHFSLDAFRNPAMRLTAVPHWCLWILPFLMGVVYFYGGIAKMGTDWLAGYPMVLWLRNVHDMPLLGSLWALPQTALFMSWSGMLIDLLAPFMLLFRKTRPWMLLVLLLFHLTNTLIFQIGIFPWLSITLSLLYFSPQWHQKAFTILRRKLKPLRQLDELWLRKVSGTAPLSAYPGSLPRFATSWILALLATFHLLMPLRHHLFEGPVAWTEEGHRFSWRMMLRTKSGGGYFQLLPPGEEKAQRISPHKYLNARQLEKLYTHPDMIWQFAQHLAADHERQHGHRPAVFARIRCRLNGRPMQSFIDPETDLAALPWQPFKHDEWIVPLEGE